MKYQTLKSIGGVKGGYKTIKSRTLPYLFRGAMMVAGLSAGLAALLNPSTASAEEWEKTRGMVTVSLTDLVASEVNTNAWNINLDLGYRKRIGDQLLSAELDWDYGQLRDERNRTSNVSPDNFDFDTKYLMKIDEPSPFLQFSALSEHDFQPLMIGLGGGYRLFVGPFALDLGFQGTKDIASGSNPETSFRADLSFLYNRRPVVLAPGLTLGIDARSQRSLTETNNRQDIFEISTNYQLSGKSTLSLKTRWENPFQEEGSKQTIQFMVGHPL